MKKDEYNDFVDLMELLSLNFKGEVTEEKIALYFDELKQYKLIAVERGIRFLISERIYPDFPIVGHIREAIINSRHKRIIKP